jgi:glycosyltransferase involved in cell wall biosynthesis
LACKGDLIFTCDQDDIWSPEKIELMAKEMDSHPEINLLACEVQPFYEGKNETYRVDKPDSHNGVLEPVGLEGSDFLYTMRPGCAHCIRREFVQVIAPWWKETYAHDEFLWRYSALTRSLVRYNKVLVKFRRHGDNASARGIVTRESRLDVMEYDIDFFEQARDYLVYQGAMTDELDRLLDGLNAWFVARRNVLSGKVTLKDLHEMLCIGKRWYSSWKGPLVDLFFAIRPTGSLHA